MSDRLRIGVIGPGYVATRAVMPAITASHNATLTAVASRDPVRAAAAAQPYGARAVGYDDLIADPAIDAIYLALPNSLHRPWTERAAAAGKHVLCEKPLATTAADARAMIAACQDIVLMEAIMFRFHPRARRLAELVRSGAIGAPRHVHAAFSFPMRDATTYRRDPARGGGALFDVGGYCLSAVRWLAGEPMLVGATATMRGGVDWQTSAALRTPSGSATILASFLGAEHQIVQVTGEDGVATMPLAFTAWKDDATTFTFGEMTELFEPADPYQLMVEHFADACLGRAPLDMPPADALATLTVIDAIRAYASGG